MTSPPVQVLLVEDSEDDALLIAHRLSGHDEPIATLRVETAFSLQAALDARDWDIVISDYRMPLLSGLDALRIVRSHNRELPFILVSSTVGEDVAVEAMRSGAADYVMKNRLARLLPAFQRELHAGRARRAGHGERQEQRRHIERLVHYDATTGLANRTLFDERLAAAIAGDAHARHAVLVVQFDRFGTVTEIVGQEAGDQLVVQAAGRLAKAAGGAHAVARIGPDRFAVALAGIGAGTDAIETLRGSIVDSFGFAITVGGSEFRLDPCIGAAIYPCDGSAAEVVLRNAEAASAHAKVSAIPFILYAEQMTAHGAEKLAMEARLRRALERGEFVLHYQPKVDLRSGEVGSVEALIRWMSPELGLVYPAQFIPLLEETGLIVEVGAWVLRQAAQDQRLWSRTIANAPRIAVNVSMSQLHHPAFAALVEDAVCAGGQAPRVDLEITESLLMQNVEENIAKLAALRALGIAISIDDFGTGYSSLAYLARLPVAAIKVDRLFVARMLEEPGTLHLVATMIELAHSLKLRVIAEGVESREQALALRALDCDEIQGYLIGRAVSWEAIRALLEGGGVVPGFPPEGSPSGPPETRSAAGLDVRAVRSRLA